MHIKKLELSDLDHSMVIARYINNNQNNNQIPQVCYPLIAYFSLHLCAYDSIHKFLNHI